jgi:hypothetical protein
MDWTQIKSELISKYGQWLPKLPIGFDTIDQVIIYTAQRAANETCPYDPYRVERLLADISRLIDRIFSYRKEGYDLDVAGTTWALDYDLFDNTLPGNITLDKAEYLAAERSEERSARSDAATAFGNSRDKLAPGFKQLLLRPQDSKEKAEMGERDRLAAIDKKWELLKQHQNKLQERHKLTGGSLNYKERLNRLILLLVEDVRDAYLKARAAERGLKRVFGIDLPLPPLDSLFLEGFLVWVRKAIRQLEIDQLDDVEFEHIVYLIQYRGDSQSSGVMADHWNGYVVPMTPGNDGTLLVDLRAYFDSAPLGAHLWLRGVGLSFSVQNVDVSSWRLFRLSAQVFPPPVDNLFASDPASPQIPRTPVMLTNIGITNPSEPARIFRGPSVYNIDPRGIWTLKVNHTFR